jgi:hypothetical protein
MEFRPDQWRLIQTAVRRYQIDKCLHDSKEYWECSDILDEIFDLCYDHGRDQPT